MSWLSRVATLPTHMLTHQDKITVIRYTDYIHCTCIYRIHVNQQAGYSKCMHKKEWYSAHTCTYIFTRTRTFWVEPPLWYPSLSPLRSQMYVYRCTPGGWDCTFTFNIYIVGLCDVWLFVAKGTVLHWLNHDMNMKVKYIHCTVLGTCIHIPVWDTCPFHWEEF
jgi:hypothetical protein